MKTRYHRFVLMLLLLCLVGASGFFAIWLFRGPRINVYPAIENGKVVFEIPYTGINGLLGFKVEEGERTVWAIKTSYERGHEITYGVLPTGGKMVAHQIVPPSGERLPDIRGKRVTVSVEYQYDSGFAACSDSFSTPLDIP
jgi:hypothetical protein